MTRTVYTNYWVSQRDDVKRMHGSYESEEEALAAIQAWWEIHKETHTNVEQIRTNTGALEIQYGNPNYFYRIEKEQTSEPAPDRSYKVRSQGEIDALRKKHQLNDESFLFDELAEPYRDRLIVAMGTPKKARKYSYTQAGEPIVELDILGKIDYEIN